MRVLQFIPSLAAKDGGTTTYMQELAPALGRLVELHVCALGNKEEQVMLQNATVHTIEKSLKHICTMRRQWMALLDEVKPDIVHINCCWMPQCALVQYWTRKYKFQVPGSKFQVFLTPHGMLEPWIISRHYWTKKVPAILLYQKWAVRNADVVVATAEEERKHIADLKWNDRIAMIPNGIDTARIEMKSSWKDAGDILFMSRIHPKKGLEMLIEAMTQTTKLKLKIAGEGEPEYTESLKVLVSNKSLNDRIDFVGAVYGDEKWKLIREADVVVLPSYSENFGLIVAEALASGTPVLTTTGAPWKPIADQNCGWWVEPNTDEIRTALKAVETTTAEQLKTMGESARTMVETLFDVRNMAESLFAIYRTAQKK